MPNALLHALPNDGETLAQVVAGTLAVAVVVWHGLGVVVCAAARARPDRRALVRLSGWSPALARGAAGIACASMVLAPVTAHAAPGSPTTVAADEPFVRAPAPGSTTTVAPPATAPASVPAPPPPAAPAPASASRTHVVQPGDNLWRIAANEVTRISGDPNPADRDIVPYWRAVMDANRTTLRSGDPSRIFPGEIVALPAP